MKPRQCTWSHRCRRPPRAWTPGVLWREINPRTAAKWNYSPRFMERFRVRSSALPQRVLVHGRFSLSRCQVKWDTPQRVCWTWKRKREGGGGEKERQKNETRQRNLNWSTVGKDCIIFCTYHLRRFEHLTKWCVKERLGIKIRDWHGYNVSIISV